MKHLLQLLLIFCVVCSFANATTITFSTPAGSTLGPQSRPENATATFTTGTNTVTVTLTNLENNPIDVLQGISDVGFVLSTGQMTGTLASSATQLVDIASNGSMSLENGGATASTGWALENNSGGGLRLCDLCGGAAGPAHLIIGGPGPGNTYSSANNSITGNGPHNPFSFETATFNLTVAGVTASSTISSAFLSFGTTEGNNITLTPNSPAPPPAPEPTSILLTGGGLVAVAMILRRRRAAC